MLKVVLYLLSLTLAYLFGYYEHPKTPESAPAVSESTTPAQAAPDEAAAVPLATTGAMPSSTPELVSATPPAKVEQAVAVAPSAPAASPVKPANTVTITQPVEIPVKDDGGKITGYINLQRGQTVTPLSVDHDQIKIKSGSTFVMVPVTSTDMAH